MNHMNKCKKNCKALGELCHNTKNRVIEKMCDCEKDKCRVLGDYLQSLMVVESLCDYVCICCCEQENISKAIHTELNNKCGLLSKNCSKLQKLLNKEQYEYINCKEVIGFCNTCRDLNKSNKKTKKK